MSWSQRAIVSDAAARALNRVGCICVAVILHVLGLVVVLNGLQTYKPENDIATVLATLEAPVTAPPRPQLLPPKLATPLIQVPQPAVRIDETAPANEIAATYEPVAAVEPIPAPPPQAAPSQVPQDYAALLSAHLAQVKQYPPSARRALRQGAAVVVLKLERSGKVINWHLVQGTGSEDLDTEIARMVAAADPFPPFPDSMPQALQSFSVPVSFTLRSWSAR